MPPPTGVIPSGSAPPTAPPTGAPVATGTPRGPPPVAPPGARAPTGPSPLAGTPRGPPPLSRRASNASLPTSGPPASAPPPPPSAAPISAAPVAAAPHSAPPTSAPPASAPPASGPPPPAGGVSPRMTSAPVGAPRGPAADGAVGFEVLLKGGDACRLAPSVRDATIEGQLLRNELLKALEGSAVNKERTTVAITAANTAELSIAVEGTVAAGPSRDDRRAVCVKLVEFLRDNPFGDAIGRVVSASDRRFNGALRLTVAAAFVNDVRIEAKALRKAETASPSLQPVAGAEGNGVLVPAAVPEETAHKRRTNPIDYKATHQDAAPVHLVAESQTRTKSVSGTQDQAYPVQLPEPERRPAVVRQLPPHPILVRDEERYAPPERHHAYSSNGYARQPESGFYGGQSARNGYAPQQYPVQQEGAGRGPQGAWPEPHHHSTSYTTMETYFQRRNRSLEAPRSQQMAAPPPGDYAPPPRIEYAPRGYNTGAPPSQAYHGQTYPVEAQARMESRPYSGADSRYSTPRGHAAPPQPSSYHVDYVQESRRMPSPAASRRTTTPYRGHEQGRPSTYAQPAAEYFPPQRYAAAPYEPDFAPHYQHRTREHF